MAGAVLAFLTLSGVPALALRPYLPPDELYHAGYVATVLDGRLPTLTTPLPAGRLPLMPADDRYRRVYVANHPPLFYVVTAAPLWFGERLGGPQAGFLAARLLSALLAAGGLVLVAWLALLLVPGRPRVAVGPPGWRRCCQLWVNVRRPLLVAVNRSGTLPLSGRCNPAVSGGRPGTGRAAVRYLVRHAHAGSQKRWRGPDQLRPLSALGDRQAVGLLARLGGYPVTRILSSPTVRCHQTVVPLSQERAVPIEVVAALDVDAPVAGLLELMADPSMATTILCGHGGQIVGALRLLCGGAASGGQLSRQKGSTWVVDRDGGDLRAVRYLPPLQLKRWPTGPNPATRSEPGFSGGGWRRR